MRISDWSSDACSSDLATIAIEQRRRSLAAVEAFLHHDEHRHFGAVLRRIEALLDRELPGVEGQLRLGEDAARSAHRVETIDGRRPREAGKGIEGFRVARFAA